MFNIDHLKHNQLANLLASLKLVPSDTRLNELQLEHEMQKQLYHQQREQQNQKVKNETLDKLKLTMKVKVKEIPYTDYAWKHVKHSLWYLCFKDIGEMDVIEIDDKTGNIVVNINSTTTKLNYSGGMWFNDDRTRATLL